MRRRRHKCKPYRPIDPAKFKATRQLARLSIESVAALLHVTPRTVSNWEHGRVAIPYAAFKLLRVLLAVELPHEAWQGWTIQGDTLWSPERRPYSAAYLGYNWLTFTMARNWAEYVRMARVAAAMARERHPAATGPSLRLVQTRTG
ncbi:MAG TPA: VC1465 family Xer recombination activation factor [Parasulfuritortus sp.]